MPLARVTVTLPASVLREADRRARALDRSRSWVVAEALRRFVAVRAEGSPGAQTAAVVREVPGAPYAAGLGPQRLAQLQRDLRLTPEGRVLAAEETYGLWVSANPRPRVRAIRSFERYEDFLNWLRVRDFAP